MTREWPGRARRSARWALLALVVGAAHAPAIAAPRLEPHPVGAMSSAPILDLLAGRAAGAAMTPASPCAAFGGSSAASCLDPAWGGAGPILAAAPGGSQTPAAAPAVNRSGLAWVSGAACPSDDFETFRGRPLDVQVGYIRFNTWHSMVNVIGSWEFDRFVASPARPSFGMGMLPSTHPQQFAQCARGDFDDEIRAVGRALVARGLGDAILRLGWEANRPNGYAWGVKDDGALYRQCFRRQVGVLRSVSPGFSIDWVMSKKGHLTFNVAQIYPGDDVVDFIGSQHFDRIPTLRTQAEWDAQYNATYLDGPYGIGAWLAFAKSRGKRFSVPEWGVSNNDGYVLSEGFDNPFFVRKMYQFFRRNAADLAYEGYFNCGSETGPYRIRSTVANVKAAAQYRRSYSRR